MRFYTLANKEVVTASNKDKDNDKLLAIIEVVLLVFITTFIPALIRLGRPPQNIEEIWVELLIAILASVYAWARVRGVNLDPE